MRLRRHKRAQCSAGTSYSIPASHDVGTKGVCPFCGYIGPPQLCGCVTEVANMLRKMMWNAPIVDDLTQEAGDVLLRHDNRVKLLNERYRALRIPR